jgi:hypothetical protein
MSFSLFGLLQSLINTFAISDRVTVPLSSICRLNKPISEDNYNGVS